jgi:hypothetical protein
MVDDIPPKTGWQKGYQPSQVLPPKPQGGHQPSTGERPPPNPPNEGSGVQAPAKQN